MKPPQVLIHRSHQSLDRGVQLQSRRPQMREAEQVPSSQAAACRCWLGCSLGTRPAGGGDGVTDVHWAAYSLHVTTTAQDDILSVARASNRLP